MSIRLFGPSGSNISRSGTTIENEPIIKSDGAGEMMQWQPSDGGADGVFIVQDASDGAGKLGVGITPDSGNLQVNDASGAIVAVTRTAGSNNDDLGTIRFGNTDVDTNLVNIIASQDGSTDSGRITFETQASGAATAARMAINSTGTMTLTANDPQLILSDSAGTNKLLEVRSNNGNFELVSRDNASNGTFKFIGEAGGTETTQLEISAAGDVTQAGGKYVLKDGSGANVGEISNINGNNLTISGVQTNHCGFSFATNAILPVTQSATNNNTVDLGANGNAYKDLYIAGSATIGAFTIPATGGSSGQVLKYPSSGSTLEWGTASSSFGSLEIGHGLGGDVQSTAIGTAALDASLSTSLHNTAVGHDALTALNHADADFNTAVGSYAGAAITSGMRNTAVGYAALDASDDGDYNTAVGMSSLGANCGDNNTAVGNAALEQFTGSDATAVGSGAADAATSAARLVAVGKDALGACTDGHDNTAVGFEALSANVSADTCTAIGSKSQKSNTGGASNTSVGKMALYSCATGDANTAAGHDAGYNTLGSSNVAVGMNSAYYGTTTDDCVAIGRNALLGATGATTGNENLAIGSYSLDAATVAHSCVAVGHGALSAITYQNNTTAIGHSAFGNLTAVSPYGVAVGWFAGRYATSAQKSTLVGYSSCGGATLTGDENTCLGYETGNSLTSGGNNTLIGSECGNALNTGGYNVAVGENALGSTDGGGNNVAIGRDAIGVADANSNNTAVGNGALRSATTDGAVAVGSYASYKTTSAARTTAIGYAALEDNLTGADNTAVGYAALKDTTGTENTAVGSNALDELVAGSYNTAVGSLSMGNADGGEEYNTSIGRCALFGLDDNAADKNVAIGADAGRYYETTASATPGSATPDGNNNAGSNSIFIGYDTRSAESDRSNEIVIGYTAVSNGSNSITLGNDDVSAIHCADTSIAALSDRRIKRDVRDAENVGLAFVEKLNAIEYKKLNPADWPEEIRSHQYRVEEHQELVTPAVKAEPAVWADAVEEVTKEVVIPAVDAVYEDVVIPAVEEIIGERETYDEVEVTEEVEKVEMVKGEGDEYVRTVRTETVTRTERTPLYDEHPVVNEDGTPCLKVVEPAITEERQVLDENGDGVINEDGTPLMETVEVKAEVTEQVIHLCPIRESYVVQEAQPERIERKIITPAQPERTETVVVTSAKERRLVKPAVEAADAVYKTVTVPADERPEDNDTNYVGLIAQDVQTAMTDAGVDFDLVTEGANGKLAVKYSNLVIPLLKAVQELSAEVKALKNG